MEIVFRLPGRFNSPKCKNEFTQDDLDAIYDDFIAGMIQVDLYQKHARNCEAVENHYK